MAGGYALASKMFQPIISRPWKTNVSVEMISKSQRLMLDNAIITLAGSKGFHHYLPLGLRSLNKLICIIRQEMNNAGASELLLSNLCAKRLWQLSGRWEQVCPELFTLIDRRKNEYCLCPTHEEPITDLIGKVNTTQAHLPLLLYQISAKYRDEPNPRFGLCRSREFFMKDLYSFDADRAGAELTYRRLALAYKNVFERLSIHYCVAEANVGTIGGTKSHEYHIRSSAGEDTVRVCTCCHNAISADLDVDAGRCAKCNSEMETIRCHEVAHTFILGTKYSSTLQAKYLTSNGDHQLLYMGCYGIGISRLLASIVEAKSTDDQIRWPRNIAPFKVCVVPPKMGSREETVSNLAMDVAQSLSKFPNLEGEILFDDRRDKNVGWRLREAKKLGYPYVVVVNKTALQKPVPLFELHDVNLGRVMNVSHAELFATLASV